MRRKTLRCLFLVLGLFSIIPVVAGANYFESDNVYFRANPNVIVKYAADLYFDVFEMDDSTYLRVNNTIVLLNITALNAAQATVVFNASGRDAIYEFGWQPANPYVSTLDGEITNLDVSAFSVPTLALNFTVNATAATTSVTSVYCGARGEPESVVGATSSSYNGSTTILTVNIIHASPTDISISWLTASTPAPSGFDAVIITLYRNIAFASIGIIVAVAGFLIIIMRGGETEDVPTMMIGVIAVIVGLVVILLIIGSIAGAIV